MPLSYGYVETLGFVGALEAADAMLKAAKVKLIDKREIGFGLVTVIIEGQLGAVQSSVDAGCVAAERIGQLISSNVIPRPYTDANFFSVAKIRKEKNVTKEVHKFKTADSQKEKKARSPKPVSDAQQVIINILKNVRQKGASLSEISKLLGMDQAHTRVILKELLDKEEIEKVQQKYYII